MNVKEISDLFNVSGQTVRRVINEIYPSKIQKGKTTRLNKEEAIKIGERIRKTGYVQPQQNIEVPQQNVEVVKMFTAAINNLNATMQNMNKRIVELENRPKQLEYKKEEVFYYTVSGWSRKNKYNLNAQEIRAISRCCWQLSQQHAIDIKQIEDTRNGYVTIYHKIVLKKGFEIFFKKKEEKDRTLWSE
jgi:hypothetical protein